MQDISRKASTSTKNENREESKPFKSQFAQSIIKDDAALSKLYSMSTQDAKGYYENLLV